MKIHAVVSGTSAICTLTDDLGRPINGVAQSVAGPDEPIYTQAALDAAVAAERERCAKVCEQMADAPEASSEGYELGCAAAIRAG